MTQMQTPWGVPDTVTLIAPGITLFQTPSHGGYFLDPDRLALIPLAWRLARYPSQATPDSPWFEVDCDWALVALTFPKFFRGAAVPAQLTFNAVHRPKIEKAAA